jgi:hypothetical protein
MILSIRTTGGQIVRVRSAEGPGSAHRPCLRAPVASTPYRHAVIVGPGLELDERVTYAEVFTRRWVVETLLDLVGYGRTQDLTRLVWSSPRLMAVRPSIQRAIVDTSEKHE